MLPQPGPGVHSTAQPRFANEPALALLPAEPLRGEGAKRRQDIVVLLVLHLEI